MSFALTASSTDWYVQREGTIFSIHSRWLYFAPIFYLASASLLGITAIGALRGRSSANLVTSVAWLVAGAASVLALSVLAPPCRPFLFHWPPRPRYFARIFGPLPFRTSKLHGELPLNPATLPRSVSFLGLTPQEVTNLLGPARSHGFGGLSYFLMREGERATLQLVFDTDFFGRPRVVAAQLRSEVIGEP
jgi:hypothetical protein